MKVLIETSLSPVLWRGSRHAVCLRCQMRQAARNQNKKVRQGATATVTVYELRDSDGCASATILIRFNNVFLNLERDNYYRGSTE